MDIFVILVMIYKYRYMYMEIIFFNQYMNNQYRNLS